MHAPQRLNRLAISFAVASLLSACGGGGSSDVAPPPPPPPPAAGNITLTGVVARGAALVNASVDVTCATGTGTATTSATGAYSVPIAVGAFPCVLRATSSDGALRLHSVAPASTASSVTANVTPLTELLVARLSGTEPAAFFTSANTSILTTAATPSAVTAAQSSVASTLLAGGVDTSTAGNFISGPLVATAPGVTQNDYDRVLDALNAQLTTAGTTLAALTTSVASGSPTAPVIPNNSGSSDVASLPADLLLKAKASNCASLASSSYQLIKFAPSPGSTVTAVDTVDFDAATLTLRLPGTTTVVDTFTPNDNCRYSNAAGADIVVSPAGVLVVHATLGANDTSVAASARGTRRMIIGLPVQNIAVAELAGNWNGIGWERNGAGVFEEVGGTATVASSGAITSFKCGSLLTATGACVTETTLLPVFSTNSAGGLNLTSTDPNEPYVDRAFAYRAGNGELMTVLLSPGGSPFILTKERTLTLPAVGTVSSNWNLDINTAGLAASALYSRTHTVASVSGSTLVRNTSNDASTVTGPQTLQYNVARNGYIYRPGATVTTASDGSNRAVRELFSLPLRGFGLTPYYVPATSGTGASPAFFGMGVARQP